MSDDNVPCSLFRINNNMETTYVEYITTREMIGEKKNSDMLQEHCYYK
jgi:hypothetical protein